MLLERLRKAGWSAVALLLFLGFVEILARRMSAGEEHRHLQMDFDADLLWGLTNEPARGPQHRVNSLGLRGDELSEGPSVRILTLGDSSVYGHGVAVEEVFSSILAARIDGLNPPVPVEPVIGGVPGYSTFQSLRLLGRLVHTVHPDVVIIGNMWSDAYRAAISDRAWCAELAAAYGPWEPLVAPLSVISRYSALARWMRQSIHDGFFPEKGNANEIGWSHLIEPTSGRAGPPKKGSPGDLPTSRVPLAEYGANLHALAAVARAAGAVPVYLMLPHPIDAIEGALQEEHAYRETMRAVAAAESALLVDASAWFLAHPSAEPRFSDDIHPDARGHADIATAILDALPTSPETAARLGVPLP